MASARQDPLRCLLAERSDAILERWLDAALSVYPDEGGAFFKRTGDPFANPVGQGLRDGTRQLLQALAAEDAGPALEAPLRSILRIRAVQTMPASRAVAFVLDLKKAVRAGIGPAATTPLAGALADFDERIDRLALLAFDIYVESREELARVRIREVERGVGWIVDRLNGRSAESRRVAGEDQRAG